MRLNHCRVLEPHVAQHESLISQKYIQMKSKWNLLQPGFRRLVDCLDFIFNLSMKSVLGFFPTLMLGMVLRLSHPKGVLFH